MTRRFDAIVIGAGQAGPPMAGRLAAAGKTVAVIERKLVGGTCVNTGCTPTKTLVASAYAAHLARRAGDFGVSAGPVGVDLRRRHGPQGQGRRRLPLQPRGLAARNAQLRPHQGSRPLSVADDASGSATTCSRPTASSSTSAAGPPCPIFRVSTR